MHEPQRNVIFEMNQITFIKQFNTTRNDMCCTARTTEQKSVASPEQIKIKQSIIQAVFS